MPDNFILLNNYKMLGHDVEFIESTGKTHSKAKPNYCCVVMVSGEAKGMASGKSTKREAKTAAVAAAVESLCLD